MLEKMPLVSVMIPAYRRPDYCELAVMSALRQDYPALEVIVCDNSPEEDTAERLRPYSSDKRFRYVRNREAHSKADNFRPFESLAQGEYLQWLMDDDLLYPGKISQMAEVLRSHPDVSLVTSNRQFIDEAGRKVPRSDSLQDVPEPCGVIDGAELGRTMLMDVQNYIGEPSAVLFRRKDLQHHYWGADCRGYTVISDVAMWLELLEKGSCVVFKQPLSAYRRHARQEGQQAEVVLLSRLEWLQLGEEYYGRHIFLRQPDEYAQMLGRMLKECDDCLQGERALAPGASDQAYQAYIAGMKLARQRLEILKGEAGTEVRVDG